MTGEWGVGDGGRVLALGGELRRLHDSIRDVLDDAREGVDPSVGTASLTDDLVLRCRAVCTVLSAHHRDEDAALFPWLRRELVAVLDAVDGAGPPLPERFWRVDRRVG